MGADTPGPRPGASFGVVEVERRSEISSLRCCDDFFFRCDTKAGCRAIAVGEVRVEEKMRRTKEYGERFGEWRLGNLVHW